MTATSPH